MGEAHRGHHLYFAACGVGRIENAEHARKVIHVGVCVQASDYGPFAEVFVGEVQPGTRGFRAGERVDDDPPCLAPDEGHVSDVEGADLIDAFDHFKQTVVLRVELSLAPQARVDGVRRVFVQETHLTEVVGIAAATIMFDG